MYSASRTLIVRSVIWIGLAMLCVVVLHLGNNALVLHVGQFSPLLGAVIGACLALFSVLSPMKRGEGTERWLQNERLAWTLIALGVVMWGIGESFWRYYEAMGETPFPSLADAGYSCFPLLVFIGLLLQPPSGSGRKRTLLVLDSLISMGSILAIAWYLLLGSLAQAPGEANLAKFLGIYYPMGDTALMSCVVFLLLRGQGRPYQATARRVSLQLIGLGLCFFVFSDFLFNVQQNAGTYVEATWIDMGWPLGMMTIGLAVYLRRFLPATSSEVIEERMQRRADHITFGPTQLLPYILLGLLFVTLTLNVLSQDSGQRAIRPVLLVATLAVVAMVVVRQLLTLRDNVRLAQKQAEALENLAEANRQIEEQSTMIALHNDALQKGIEHLAAVQASLANGNLRARAELKSGPLMSLAGSLNVMAERLMRFWQGSMYAQRLVTALTDLSTAIDQQWRGTPFVLPESCKDLAEITNLLRALHMKGNTGPYNTLTQPLAPKIAGNMNTAPRRPFPRITSDHGIVAQEGTIQGEPQSLQRFPKSEPLPSGSFIRERLSGE